MPPKLRITREDIINTALEIVRNDGEEALNARSIASKLACSTQPVFSNFSCMNELRLAVIGRAEEIFNERMNAEISAGRYVAYKASGMAYIKFAMEEKELFKLLYMRDRSDEEMHAEDSLLDRMSGMVTDNTGLQGDKSLLFHLEIWTAVHGIASMVATGYLKLELDLISSMITDIYQGLKLRYEREN